MPEDSPLNRLTSSIKEPSWAKPWAVMAREFARLRAWLEFIQFKQPECIEAVTEIALLTSGWPDQIKLCPSCGHPTLLTKLECDVCSGRAEDHDHELDGYTEAHYFAE